MAIPDAAPWTFLISVGGILACSRPPLQDGVTTAAPRAADAAALPTTSLDHVIAMSTHDADFQDLRARGFVVDDSRASQPGHDRCYYVFFPPKRERPSYAELCVVDDLDAFGASHRARGTRSGVDLLAPGIAWRHDGPLRARYDRARAEGRDDIFYLHRDYPGPDSADGARPGWNFIHFRTPPIPNVYTFFVEYEPSPVRKPVADAAFEHPNTVIGLRGVVLGLSDPADSLRLVRETGGRTSDGRIELQGGSTVWTDASPALQAKTSSFAAVVLRAASLDAFVAAAHPDAVTTWNGERAAVIHTRPSAWDIVVTE